MALLVGRERVDDAVDRLRRAIRVQRAHDEDAHFGCRNGDRYGLQVAHLADENDVGIFAQCRVQGLGERGAVHADLALADQALLGLVHELDRVLDRQDVALHVLVDRVDHGGERRRFSRAGLAGHEDHARRLLAHVVNNLRHAEFFERQRFRRDGAEDAADTIEVPKCIGAEPRYALDFIGEVGGFLFFESALGRRIHDLVQRFLGKL